LVLILEKTDVLVLELVLERDAHGKLLVIIVSAGNRLILMTREVSIVHVYKCSREVDEGAEGP